MKKKLLVLAYEYYPTENANTRIIRNTCGILAERYEIDLVTVAPAGTGSSEALFAPLRSDPGGDFHIIRVPGYSFHREKCTGALTPSALGRMVFEKALGRLEHDDTRMLERLYEREVRKAVRVTEYDAVVSFSAPILAHGCASRMVRGTGVPWVAVCFDPYFDHRVFGPEHLETRKRREEKYMEPASRVLVMVPTDRDYLAAGVAFGDKMTGFEVPGVGHGEPVPVTHPLRSDSRGEIRCGFFGSMYRGIRDPRAAILLFNEAAGETGIAVRFAGQLEGFSAEELFPAGSRVQYLGTLRGEELERAYAETDILINIGNAVDNQIPSKIFEYISTGKPVVNIYKTPECPTLRYLTRYPLALNLFEGDIAEDLPGTAEKVRRFCLENRGKRVSAEEIRERFAENTFEAFAEILAQQIG